MTTIRVQGNPLYQWDTDRRVIIEPGNGVTIDDVHFSTDGENSIGVEHAADENGIVSAPIPNILLQSGSNITVYACMATDNGQHTIASRIVSVINRAKPADYVYTETEVKSYAALKKKLSEKLPANQGAENAGKALVIDDDGNVVPGEVQGSGGDGAGVDITGAAAGQIPQIADVDENGVPTAWQPADLPSGGGEKPWVNFCTAEITEDVNELEFTGVDDYTDFLLIGDFAGGNTSGVVLYMNGKLVSVGLGSYFVHNHRKFNVTRLEIDKIRGFYRFSSSSQQYGYSANQDRSGEYVFGQTLANGENITSFSFRMAKSGSYVKAGSRYTLYAR